ncbi:hypothetical protein N0V93_004103 [Gnomoniopsis smithogilvyi]|uniref:Xylanolytic transcriptional activator regulatory domain-containing protein n=1 Tax=Gnomoniopsis smithogilvyi TaxID=1191159 RepID=A0A9W8YZY4_9PEZI|nr:hypothetical protein N0V93_004103 [Gnomoniopsis smithogilvyi]
MSIGSVPGSVSAKSSTPMPHHQIAYSHRRSSDAVISPEDHDEAEVPREARLLCDAQGKLIFIGDCAPLSFFQTVRQLVTSRVDSHAFAPQTSQYSVLENATSKSFFTSGAVSPPEVRVEDIPDTVAAYLSVSSGMVNLFASEARLTDMLTMWASNTAEIDDVSTAVNYLVLAIGLQEKNEDLAQQYFEYARDQALSTLNGSLGTQTVKAFILITLYMLCACQINGAFLFFGIAVRAAYSIGIHRTEVNQRFGDEQRHHRDNLWKSLRIVDLFLSTSMGRPPCTSDVDCTVPYRQVDNEGREMFDILNASVQIFLILEGIVLEVYTRRKITPQLTEGISRQLRDFSVRWLDQMKRVVSSPNESSSADVSGACQVLASYYYAVMLVTRPFLMYELYRRLSPEPATIYRRAGLVSGKSKLADACIDAASMMVDQISDLIEKGSWLFAGSLVLGAGLLGSFGRILEKYARMAMAALEHFAKLDAHAAQYAMITKSLLTTAVEFLERREVQERLQRTESSAQLFGLIPHQHREADSISVRKSPEMNRKLNNGSPGGTAGSRDTGGTHHGESLMGDNHPTGGTMGMASPFFSDLDPAFLTMSTSLPHTPDLLMSGAFDGDESSFGGLNLFPLLETGGGGHIDLAHYL